MICPISFSWISFQIGVRREVDKEEGQALADLLGALFIETSAKQVNSVYPFEEIGGVFEFKHLRNTRCTLNMYRIASNLLNESRC